MPTSPIKFPDVDVRLTGTDGNVFSVIGNVSRALRRAGHPETATEFSTAAMSCESYDAVLRLAMQTVDVS